jgi:DNA-binding transcriptional ArsR family regulator
VQISDPRAIRALAHPLRLDLLQLLGAIGTATAAECGRMLGQSQASCSFHLRQLAKYGLVEDAGPGPDRRERRWQVLDPRLRLRFDAEEPARQQVEQSVVEREMRAILDYSQRPGRSRERWRHKAGIVASMAIVTPEDVAQIKEQWIQLLAPYVARARAAGPELAPGQHPVRYFMAATPLPDPSAGDSEHGSDD